MGGIEHFFKGESFGAKGTVVNPAMQFPPFAQGSMREDLFQINRIVPKRLVQTDARQEDVVFRLPIPAYTSRVPRNGSALRSRKALSPLFPTFFPPPLKRLQGFW